MVKRAYSGKLNLRLPAGLHAALVAEAERQGVSLNTLIISLLAGALGWRQPKHGSRQP